MLVLILYVPLLERVFGTYAMSTGEWLIIAVAAFTVSPVLELTKWAERRGWFGRLG
jgi:Ca2+-transporting ATPase